MLQRIGKNRMIIAVSLLGGWAGISLAAIVSGVFVSGSVAAVLTAAGATEAVSNVVAIGSAFTAAAGIIATVTTAVMLALQNVVRPDNDGPGEEGE